MGILLENYPQKLPHGKASQERLGIPGPGNGNLWKKFTQCESQELSFVASKMRSAAWETTFQIVLRNCLEEVKGEPAYTEVLQQRSGCLNSKQLLLIQENQIPKLKNWVLFYVWEDARVWAHWNHSFDMHLSSLGPVSCVFTSWVSSGLTVGSGCSLMAPRWQVFFPSWVPSGLTSWPSIVAADDCDILCLLIWRRYSVSQGEPTWVKSCL